MKDITYKYASDNINVEDLKELVNECNSWNGTLEWLEVYENDEYFINDLFYGKEPYEILRMSHFGDYNLNDDYIRFNGYGNLESIDDCDYCKELEGYKKEIIETAFDLWQDNKIEVSVSLEYVFDDMQRLEY